MYVINTDNGNNQKVICFPCACCMQDKKKIEFLPLQVCPFTVIIIQVKSTQLSMKFSLLINMEMPTKIY